MTTATLTESPIYFKSPYTERQVVALIKEYQTSKSQRAADALLIIFKKLCQKIAHNYTRSGISFADAFQDACLGLYVGVNAFDMERFGIVTLSSFLTRAINDRIKDELKGYTIKIGTTASKNVWLVKQKMADDNLTFDQACEAMGLSKRKTNAVRAAMVAVGLSGISEDMESTLSNHKNPVLSEIMRDEEEKLFKARLMKLDTKYRVLIEMKLEGAMDKQIAAKLDCSIPSISNWFKKACSLLSKS